MRPQSGSSHRAIWNDKPEQLAPAWTLTKDRKIAVCEVWSHAFGWEIKLGVAGSMIRTQVCRTATEMLETFDQWRAEMRKAGWIDSRADVTQTGGAR